MFAGVAEEKQCEDLVKLNPPSLENFSTSDTTPDIEPLRLPWSWISKYAAEDAEMSHSHTATATIYRPPQPVFSEVGAAALPGRNIPVANVFQAADQSGDSDQWSR